MTTGGGVLTAQVSRLDRALEGPADGLEARVTGLLPTGFGPEQAGKEQGEEMVMNFHQSHLRPDGTTWPPVTPDPPPPPGYLDPVADPDDTREPHPGADGAGPPDAPPPAEGA